MNSALMITDIHKIRHENYEKTKLLSNEELIKLTKEQASPGWQRIALARKKNGLAATTSGQNAK